MKGMPRGLLLLALVLLFNLQDLLLLSICAILGNHFCLLQIFNYSHYSTESAITDPDRGILGLWGSTSGESQASGEKTFTSPLELKQQPLDLSYNINWVSILMDIIIECLL